MRSFLLCKLQILKKLPIDRERGGGGKFPDVIKTLMVYWFSCKKFLRLLLDLWGLFNAENMACIIGTCLNITTF